MTSVLSDPIFHDEDKARAHFEALRWPDGRACPHCGTIGNSTLMQGKSHRAGLYKCKDCRKAFTATMGTVFERSHIPLTKWLLATHLMCASKKGMSALQLHRMLGFGSYKTAWFMCHRIREAMNLTDHPIMGMDGGAVEVDETFIGSDIAAPVTRLASTSMNKVVTLVERNTGRSRSMVVKDFQRTTLEPILFANIDRRAHLMTDEAKHYITPGRQFADHGAVRHGADQYAKYPKGKPVVTTNTVEGFFSVFKRGMVGVYQHCGSQHLHRYLAEFDFRYSNRSAMGVEDVERATLAVRGAVGKRLMYRESDSMRRKALVASWVIPAPVY